MWRNFGATRPRHMFFSRSRIARALNSNRNENTQHRLSSTISAQLQMVSMARVFPSTLPLLVCCANNNKRCDVNMKCEHVSLWSSIANCFYRFLLVFFSLFQLRLRNRDKVRRNYYVTKKTLTMRLTDRYRNEVIRDSVKVSDSVIMLGSWAILAVVSS
jgi:hypothetical protein